jgi:hypothetical protein
MAPKAATVADRVIGRNPDQLSIEERFALAGKFAAFEIYTPKDLPLRRIEAVGNAVEDCVRTLIARGLDPAHFEFIVLKRSY